MIPARQRVDVMKGNMETEATNGRKKGDSSESSRDEFFLSFPPIRPPVKLQADGGKKEMKSLGQKATGGEGKTKT